MEAARWAAAALIAIAIGCSDPPADTEPIADSPCSLDETECGGACVNLNNSPDHCGSCGTPCDVGVCSRGECVDACRAGQVECNGRCVDSAVDRTFCGASGDCVGENAGTTCDSDLECFESTCSPRPASCLGYLDAGRSIGGGIYAIDPDGAGGAQPFHAVCDMSTDGGGWTLLGTISGADGNHWNTEFGLWTDTNPLGDVTAPFLDFKSPAWYLLNLTGAEVMFQRRFGGFLRAQMRIGNACITGDTLAGSFVAGGRCGRANITPITPAIDATGLSEAAYQEGVGGRGLGGNGTNGWCWNGGDTDNNDFRGHAGWNSDGDGCTANGHRGYIGVYTNGDAQFENDDITGTNWLLGTDFAQTDISFYAR